MREEKARMKREEKVIKQWTRLIQGLKIRQRLQEQYGPLQQRVEVRCCLYNVSFFFQHGDGLANL